MIFYTIVYGVSLYQSKQSSQKASSHAIAVLIDTSLSMSASDIKPNRYNYAIRITTGLMNSLPASYMTIPFGAIPLIRTPWSTDTHGIEQILSQYSLGSHHVNNAYMGSAPGNAIALAWSTLRKYKTQKKSILLLGDGSTNTGYSIESFVPDLQKDNIQLYVCVIGQSGYTIGQSYTDTPVVTSVDTSNLTSMTQATHGKRWLCNNGAPAAVQDILTTLNNSQSERTINSWLAMDILHMLAIICLSYTIFSILLSFGIYTLGTSTKTPTL